MPVKWRRYSFSTYIGLWLSGSVLLIFLPTYLGVWINSVDISPCHTIPIVVLSTSAYLYWSFQLSQGYPMLVLIKRPKTKYWTLSYRCNAGNSWGWTEKTEEEWTGCRISSLMCSIEGRRCCTVITDRSIMIPLHPKIGIMEWDEIIFCFQYLFPGNHCLLLWLSKVMWVWRAFLVACSQKSYTVVMIVILSR